MFCDVFEVGNGERCSRIRSMLCFCGDVERCYVF